MILKFITLSSIFFYAFHCFSLFFSLFFFFFCLYLTTCFYKNHSVHRIKIHSHESLKNETFKDQRIEVSAAYRDTWGPVTSPGFRFITTYERGLAEGQGYSPDPETISSCVCAVTTHGRGKNRCRLCWRCAYIRNHTQPHIYTHKYAHTSASCTRE